MKTKILKIEQKIKNNSEYKIFFFDYFGKRRFCYFSQKTEEYFKKFRNIDTINEGMIINVFAIPNTNQFRIVDIKKED